MESYLSTEAKRVRNDHRMLIKLGEVVAFVDVMFREEDYKSCPFSSQPRNCEFCSQN